MATSANGTKHQFHLVNPSAWPLLASLSMLAVTGGTVMFMHKIANGGIIMSAGLIAILSVAFMWWRDVVKESMVDKAHTGVVLKGLRLGMLLFIVSEIMFFVAFFWAYFSSAAHKFIPLQDVWPSTEIGVWPPKGVITFDPWDLPFTNTLILLLSGTTVTWAHHALLENDRKGLIRGLTCTVLLGLLFSTLQAYEYHHAAFGFKDGIYSSVFYMATGFHGAHVIIGTIFLAVCLFRAKKGHFTPKQHLGFECAAWYWHFVDVVWLFLFIGIYWAGAGSVHPAH